MFCHDEGAKQIDIEDLAEGLQFEVSNVCSAGSDDTCAVYHDIQFAVPCDGILHETLRSGFIRNVHQCLSQHAGYLADRFTRRFQCRLVDISHDHSAAFKRNPPADAQANAAAGTGHHSDLIFESS